MVVGFPIILHLTYCFKAKQEQELRIMKIRDTRSHSRSHSAASTGGSGDEEKGRRKHKPDNSPSESETSEHSGKKPKPENGNNKGKMAASEDDDSKKKDKFILGLKVGFERFCRHVSEYLTIEQMRHLLEVNHLSAMGSDDAVVPRCMDMIFYGPPGDCPVCGNNLEFRPTSYYCTGSYSEWSTCTFNTRDPPRREGELVLPYFVDETAVSDLLREHQDPQSRSKREIFESMDKPFVGMTISLSGRLSQTHQQWKADIEEYGGKVANSVLGVKCLVVSRAERLRGGSSKIAEAVENGIPVVSESWLVDCIEKQEALSFDAYDVITDLAVDGRGIPWDKLDPVEEALESLVAEIKIYGKRGVYKDSKLEEQGGKIFEKDGILYNCAFSLSDKGKELNEYAILQLITITGKPLQLYCKRGNVGNDARAQETCLEWEDVDYCVMEFENIFEDLTGNEFEPWEREKKFDKKLHKFYPIDMADGYDVRYGGLGLRQIGIAAAHCKLNPMVANFMKVLCSQEIYRYALMEMGMDVPDLPVGMLTDFHLQTCEKVLYEFVGKLSSLKVEGQRAMAVWSDFSQRWFTLMHSTRPFIFKDFKDIAEHAASGLETVGDIVVASHLIGNMTGATTDDPLTECYTKLGCSILPVEKDTEDYKMIMKYLEETYEPVKVGDISYSASVQNIFAIEAGACPSYDEIKKLPNKVLLWCGTRTSNLVRHLHKGFLPAICQLPVPGYMFGKAIVCTDAAAEAAKYGFTAVDRPEGFLILAVASLGENVKEITTIPEESKSFEDRKLGVKGLGKKKTNESEHFVWKDDIKVPCGRLVPSEHKDSVLEYNEYAVYDPRQVSICFLVSVKFDEKDVVYEEAATPPVAG